MHEESLQPHICRHVIVAEDDPAARVLLTRHLERAGYEVTACENGEVALSALRDRREGLVIADWNMPVMDGLTLCQEIRRRCAAGTLQFAYLILLTANSEKDKIVAGLDAGADDYLTKPYHSRELLARLRAGERIYGLQHQLRERQAALTELNEKLTLIANTDALTGLFNRRYLFDRLEQLWAIAVRHERPLSCIMFDIDRFKSINDTRGHAAGDAALRGVAVTARELLRREDLLARFGGEEFCILCPETGSDGAAELAERVRIAIEAAQFQFDGRAIPVTISLGVATRQPAHRSPDALIGDADAMLYKAKHGGRNQTWLDRAGSASCVRPQPVC